MHLRAHWAARLLVSTSIILLAAFPARGQLAFERVGYSGDPAPGAGEGMTFGAVTAVDISPAGTVALRARINNASGSVVGEGIWHGRAGEPLTLVARTGAPAAGGGTYASFSPTASPQINVRGDIAFESYISGSTGGTRQSYLLYTPGAGGGAGSVSLRAYAGQQQDGTSAEPIYLHQLAELRLNGSGAIAFRAARSTSPDGGWQIGPTSRPSAVLAAPPTGDPVAVVADGQTIGDKTVDSLTWRAGYPNHWITADGNVAVNVELVAGSNRTTGFVRASTTAAPTHLVAVGDPIPGLAGEFHITSVQAEAVTDGGTALLSLAARDAGSNIDSGLWVRSPSGELTRAVGRLDAIPRSGGADFIVDHFVQQPFLTEGGLVVAQARNGMAQEVLLFGAPGAMEIIAGQGDAVPGVPGFTFYSSFNPRASDTGRIAFTGSTAPAVGSVYRRGLWLADLDGSIELIGYPGTPFDIDPGPGVELRTIAAIGFDAYGDAFTDDGRLLFHAAFTDGSSGWFLTSAVPEPAGATLTLVAAMLAVGVRRDRARLAFASGLSCAAPFPPPASAARPRKAPGKNPSYSS